VRVALVGYNGYWGQKLGRVLTQLNHEIVAQIDKRNVDRLPQIDADAAIIATPPATHYGIAMTAMKAEMDVLVEKPMTLKSGEAKALAQYAKDHERVLSVDSTFCHTKAFEFLAALDEPVLHYQSLRMAQPMPQAVIPASWDLVVHDLSILANLDALPREGGYGAQDYGVAQCGFVLPSGGSAFIMASRMWPIKERSITIHFPSGAYLWTLGSLQTFVPGAMSSDFVVREDDEPLKRLINDFELRCFNREIEGLTDGEHGLATVAAVERVFSERVLCQNRPSKVGDWMLGRASV